MAYETGTATDPSDLLTKFCTFAVTNGWTSNSPSTGRVLSKGTVVAGLFGQATTFDIRGAITVANGSAWNAQTGNSGTTAQCDIGAGPYTAYHFYALTESGKDLLACCVEIVAGVFRHFLIADLIKAGTFTGGTYVDCVVWNDSSTEANDPGSTYHQYIADTPHGNSPQSGHAWVESDGGSSTWGRVLDSDNFTLRGICGSVRYHARVANLEGNGYERWNLRTPLIPIELAVTRNSSLRSPLGRVPAIRNAHMRNHTPGEIINIGGADFQLWPWCARTDAWGSNSSTVPSSAYYGVAYKRT